MSSRWTKKRSRYEDSEGNDLDELDTTDSEEIRNSSTEDIPRTHGKKRTKLEASNIDTVRSTTFKKLETAPKGSFGIPAVRALLAKSGSLSRFSSASRETNYGLRKAGRVAIGRKSSKSKGKRAAR